MYSLKDRNHQHVGGIYKNILVDTNAQVIAVILGHCVFAWDGKLKAKYFRHTLFDLNGFIVAQMEETHDREDLEPLSLMTDAWHLLGRIEDHNCPMIDPLNEWSPSSVHELLPEKKAMSARSPQFVS